MLAGSTNPALAWANGYGRAASARAAARLGQTEEALKHLADLRPWLERAPAWTANMPIMAANAAEVLWLLERLDYAELIEQTLRKKVVTPDFRTPISDGRLALARLCALSGRYDEALSWFTEARRVLRAQSALPLLSLADYDEALMYVRRGARGDLDRARPLLDAARRQFAAIGMTGWIRRADELACQLG